MTKTFHRELSWQKESFVFSSHLPTPYQRRLWFHLSLLSLFFSPKNKTKTLCILKSWCLKSFLEGEFQISQSTTQGKLSQEWGSGWAFFSSLTLTTPCQALCPGYGSEQESGPGPGPLLLGACPGGALLSDTEGQDRLPDDKEGKRGAEP